MGLQRWGEGGTLPALRYYKHRKVEKKMASANIHMVATVRSQLVNVFSPEFGIYMENTPMLTPLPDANTKCTGHVICPHGQLSYEVTVGNSTLPKDTRLALIDQTRDTYDVIAMDQNLYFTVDRDMVTITHPAVVSWNQRSLRLRVMFKPIGISSTKGFHFKLKPQADYS